jgi:hypothetical protein
VLRETEIGFEIESLTSYETGARLVATLNAPKPSVEPPRDSDQRSSRRSSRVVETVVIFAMIIGFTLLAAVLIWGPF